MVVTMMKRFMVEFFFLYFILLKYLNRRIFGLRDVIHLFQREMKVMCDYTLFIRFKVK